MENRFILREGTLDEFIVKENDYDKCNFTKDDVWLDLGSNIGAFFCKYAPKVQHIVAFEPEEENYELSMANLDEFGHTNVNIVRAAVVGNDDATREFFVNKKRNKGTHSLVVIRGRTKVVVPAVNITQMILASKANKLKIDIEGGEEEIFEALTNDQLIAIDEIIMEYHFNSLHDKDWSKYFALLDRLEEVGFIVDAKREKKNYWTAIIHAKR